MALIGFNAGASQAANAFTINTENQTRSFKKIASGSRLANPSEDAAGVSVSANLKALLSRLSASSEGSQNVVSFAQTTEGFLNTIQQQVGRLSELAQRATDGTMDPTSRAAYNIEFQGLKSQIDSITTNASFNGTPVFANGSVSTADASGVTDSFSTKDLGSTQSLGIQNLAVDTTANAQAAIGAINTAIQSIAGRRAEVGADISKFQFNIQSSRSQSLHVAEANSRIEDLDVAAESANISRLNILGKASLSVLSQANTSQRSVLSLLS
jgi:flagellin